MLHKIIKHYFDKTDTFFAKSCMTFKQCWWNAVW